MEKKVIRTFFAKVAPLYEENVYHDIYQRVPKERQDKADRLKYPEDKALSLGAWHLLMLARQKYQIEETLPFNLSHSGGYVLCSIGPTGEKVGCDVEMLGEYRENIAKRFFCHEEYEAIKKQDVENQRELFFRYWVLKESFMKATRRGLALGMETFELELSDQAAPYLKRMPKGIEGRYYFREFALPKKDARAAVCSTCERIVEPEELNLL